MPVHFVLELRDVSSLTEARFAAGEGFTHVRLTPELATGPESKVLDIKRFLSGVLIGIDRIGEAQPIPTWADYYVQDRMLIQDGKSISLDMDPNSDNILALESLANPLPDVTLLGLSLPGLQEHKVGYADYEAHQDFMEKLREKLGL
jgi:hypothetical protein